MIISDTAFRLAVVFIAVIALVFALSAAREIVAPLVLALVIGIVLSPLYRLGERLRLPPVLNALGVLCFTVWLLFLLVGLLEPPLARLIESAPAIWFEVRQMISGLQSRLAGLMQLSDVVSETLGDGADPRDAAPIPTWTEALLVAPSLAAQVMVFVGGLFFFLLTRNNLYHALGRAVPGLDRKQVLAVERRVAHYFLTISLINLCFGASVALALHVIGMPSALAWGAVAMAMNFILYLGPLLVAVSLAVTSVLVFDGPAVFLPPVVFVAINIAEGQFITPALVGRQMRVSPYLVFVSLVFGLWLWGPVGGFIAIPLLLTVQGLWEQARLARGQNRPTPIETAGTPPHAA